MHIGIIGTGNVGTALARLATAAGGDAGLANSRGPESLADLVAGLGEHATADTLAEAAQAGEVTVLSVPLSAALALPSELLDDRTVLDTTNYYPSRDGRIAELDAREATTSELLQRHFTGARLVKAFSSILAHHMTELARGPAAEDRSALPVAGDDKTAKTAVRTVVDRLGYDTVDAGAAADAWRFEPETAGYTQLYWAAPMRPGQDVEAIPARPRGRAEVEAALASAEHIDVGARTF